MQKFMSNSIFDRFFTHHDVIPNSPKARESLPWGQSKGILRQSASAMSLSGSTRACGRISPACGAAGLWASYGPLRLRSGQALSRPGGRVRDDIAS